MAEPEDPEEELLMHLQGALCESIRGVLCEELSVFRFDVRALLKEELGGIRKLTRSSISEEEASPHSRRSTSSGGLPASLMAAAASLSPPRWALPALQTLRRGSGAVQPVDEVKAPPSEEPPSPPAGLPNALEVDGCHGVPTSILRSMASTVDRSSMRILASDGSTNTSEGQEPLFRSRAYQSHNSHSGEMTEGGGFQAPKRLNQRQYQSGQPPPGSVASVVLREARMKRAKELEARRRSSMSGDTQASLHARLRFYVVEKTQFDTFFGLLVIVNAGVLGIQVDWMARNESTAPPFAFRVFEIAFCLAFTFEWLVRLLAHGRDFFSRELWHWHTFDTFLVGMQLFEEVALMSVVGFSALSESHSGDNSQGNFSWLRVLRFLRLIRVMRTVRILRLVGELRTLVLSILGSLRALIWAVVLLFLLMYVIGIFVTQLVLDHRMDGKGEDGSSIELDEINTNLLFYYGSLGDTILSIYKAITGGIDWGDLVTPLKTRISVYLVPFFMLYIAFATLCMLNVITGVFVESALASTKQDTNLYLVSRLKGLFTESDLDGDGKISSVEFFLAADTPEIQAVFAQLDIPLKEVDLLFEALDDSGAGALSAEEFVKGCQELASPAKALDIVILKSEQSRLIADAQERDEKLEAQLMTIQRRIDTLIATTSTTARRSRFSEHHQHHQHHQSDFILRPPGMAKVLPVYTHALEDHDPGEEV